MTYWTWLPLLLGLTAVCPAKEIEPFAGPRPVAVLLQENPWAAVMGAETPRIAIYENGEVIYSRGNPTQKGAAYFYAELSFPAMAEVFNHLKPVVDLQGLKPSYNLTDATDQGETLFYLCVDGKVAVTSVYGLNPQDDHQASRIQTAGQIPDELRDLYRYLLTVDFTETRPWHPTFVEAMIWPFEGVPNKTLTWPSTWPGLDSDRAMERKNGHSIFLDGSMRDKLKEFLSFENENDAVVINGKYWSVASRPVFPSEPVWRAAFANIKKN